MSVSAVLEVRRRPFPGYDEANSPLLAWAGQVVVAGDASGGTRSLSIILATATGPKTSLMWSLEQFSILDTDNNDKRMDIAVTGTDELLGTQLWVIRVTAGITSAGAEFGDLPPRGLWLGGQDAAGEASVILLTAANIDATVLVFNAQGYAWGSRSRSIPGGPQRPPRGLYAS